MPEKVIAPPGNAKNVPPYTSPEDWLLTLTQARAGPLENRDFMETDILHHSPDKGQTTHLSSEGINLIGALSNIAEEAFDGIGRLNVAMHRRWKRVKGEQMLFILHQAADRFRVTLSIFGFERIEVGQRILLLLLLPDACEFGLDFLSFSSRDGTQNIALLMD